MSSKNVGPAFSEASSGTEELEQLEYEIAALLPPDLRDEFAIVSTEVMNMMLAGKNPDSDAALMARYRKATTAPEYIAALNTVFGSQISLQEPESPKP